MNYRISLTLSFLLIINSPMVCQETNYGPGFNTILVNNPAFSGIAGNGVLRISYLNFYPGHSYNFHTFYASYDSYFQAIHGGAGFYVTNDYLGGIVNDLRAGISYSYFLQAGEDLYLHAGLSANVFNRGFNFSGAILPDEIDAMGIISLPSAENLVNSKKTALDIATGFVLISGNMFGGFSISHLTQPEISGSASSSERLQRKYLLNFAADFGIGKKDNMKIRPVAAFELQGRFVSFCEGAVLETEYFSVNAALFESNNSTIDMQAGFTVRKERLGFFYNYRFNIKSGSSLLPFSLVHQAGVAFSLNNVEKSIKVKTINMPGL